MVLVFKSLGKTEDKRRKSGAEDEIVRLHHQLSEHEFAQTPWGSEG